MKFTRNLIVVIVLSVGLILLSSVTVVAGSGATKFYDQLNKIDQGTEEAVTACNKLKDTSAKLYKEMQEITEKDVKSSQWSRFKDLRSQIHRIQDQLPSACYYMQSYRTRAISNKIELSSQCLSCLGDGDCSSREKYEKCRNYMTWMQEALESFSGYQEQFQQHARTFNHVIEQLKEL